MKKAFIYTCALVITSLAPISWAQSTSGAKISDEENQSQFWVGNFSGGQFLVPLGKLVSIAKQQYILDGTMYIHEISIDTLGPSQTRIYYIEPITNNSVANAPKIIGDRAKDLLSRGSQVASGGKIDTETVVTKNYPHTTHSKTIEFRVATLEELNAIHNSIITAWQRGKGRTYSSEKKR